jgi:hypothetical protein
VGLAVQVRHLDADAMGGSMVFPFSLGRGPNLWMVDDFNW